MLGMPTFDLTSERGKQDFQKWITFAIKNEINSYSRQVLNIDNTGAGGGGGAPTGPAGGGLTGEYPDPLIYPDMTGITSISTPQIISFNTISPGVAAIGALVWNDTTGTLELGLKGGNVNLSIGQENVVLVKHADNAGLVKGKVVYVAGSDGSNKTVRYARANAESTSSRTFGVMAEDASGGNKGFVATQGIVSDINTIGLTEGAAVYVSPSVAGDLTSTKPSAPNHIVLVGFCVRSHAVNGVLYVSVVNGFELDELHDVKITSKANGDIIKYNSSTGLWENVAADDIEPHAASHGVSGTDPVTIAPSQVTGTAVITSDSRLSDARTPTSHAGTHIPGGSDAIDLTKIIAIGATLPTLPDPLYPAGTLFGVGTIAPYLLYRSTGSAWDQIGGAGGSSVTTSDTAPSTPSDGDLWYKTSNAKTYVWYEDGSSDQWVEVGAASQLVIPQHGSSHVRGGVDVIDGDRLTVDYVPTRYTRNSAASGAGDVTDLTAHLSGVDNNLNSLWVPPMVKCTRSASAAYTNGAALTWPTEEFDTDNMHSTSTNTSRITINTTGVYVVTAAWFLTFGGTITFATPWITKNGTRAITTYITNISATTNYRFAISHIESCNVGDYLEVGVDMTGGSSFNQDFNGFNSYFAATWQGRTS